MQKIGEFFSNPEVRIFIKGPGNSIELYVIKYIFFIECKSRVDKRGITGPYF